MTDKNLSKKQLAYKIKNNNNNFESYGAIIKSLYGGIIKHILVFERTVSKATSVQSLFRVYNKNHSLYIL